MSIEAAHSNCPTLNVTLPQLFHHCFPSIGLIGRSLWLLLNKCAHLTEDGDFLESESIESILIDRSWEKLNTGHYSHVDEQWRILYTMAQACRAVRMCRLGRLKEALLACDMSLLMGRPVFNNSIAQLATDIHQQISKIDWKSPTFSHQSSTDPHEIWPRSEYLEKISRPSLMTFKLDHFDQQLPTIVTDVVTRWPAFHKWKLAFMRHSRLSVRNCSVEYFVSLAAHRTVPVEIGSKYTEHSWSQQLMTVGEFAHHFMGANRPKIGYLAQHRVFEQIPQLSRDLIIPDYCLLETNNDDVQDDVDVHLWLGPDGTISPLHTDPRHNLFCQLVGQKLILLVPDTDSEKVYANEWGMLTNTSQVDVEQFDHSVHPLFAETRQYSCLLEAGQMLFIPKGWWHYVRAVQDSISVSCWFGRPK